MAVSFLNREVSDLCLGKPALKPIPAGSTLSEALTALKKSGETHVSVWSCDHSRKVLEEDSACICIGKICMVDVILFLSKEENLVNPSKALQTPVSFILPEGNSIVRHLDPNSSLLEAIDYVLEGAQNLVIPIQNYKSTPSRKKLLSKASYLSPTSYHNGVEYCWLTQEDIVRFLLNSIGVFSPMPTFSIESLNIINHDMMTVSYHDPAISSLDDIARAYIEQSSVAVVDEENRLIGEISPFTLAYCDETVAAAIATLSAGDLMTYIDYGGPPEDLIELIKTRLQDKKLGAMVELLDEEFSLSSSSSCSASSCSSDDESGSSKATVLGRYSSARRSEAITCYPWSSLVAVMFQALAHRANSIWVMDEDHNMIGVVTFQGILEVFRSIANVRRKPERENTSKQ
ncbi:CBS domain-containing protein CBSX5 [Capsicum chacoense]